LSLAEATQSEPQNFLLVGSDSRADLVSGSENSGAFLGGGETPTGQRADTIVILRYDPQREHLYVLSIPRDLWINIAGTGARQRINTAYSYSDGPNRLIRTIQDDLGIDINHYAEVDFRGFQALVDELGGVPMYFETLYRDTNSGFGVGTPGCTRMNGPSALAFVRARHLQYMNSSGNWVSDPTGDLGRVSRQQIFLRNALARARGKMSLIKPLEYRRLLGVAVKYLKIDENLDATKLYALSQRYAEFKGNSINTYNLPVYPYMTAGGASVVGLEATAAQPILNVFRGLPPGYLAPGSIDLRVLNGSGAKNQAAKVKEAYEAIGFSVQGVGDVPGTDGNPLAHTRVRYAPGSSKLGVLVARHVVGGATLVSDSTLPAGQVVLETGADFTKVQEVLGPMPVLPKAKPGSSQSAPTTTTTVIGHVPGEPPTGTTCA
jgi:LCP family protein required for cell wall assembly